jgi:hypothetical protein
MPLYDKGSRLSKVDDFGIGQITDLLHKVGTIPLSKQMLNKTCKKERAESLVSTSTGMLSIPQDLPFLALANAL